MRVPSPSLGSRPLLLGGSSGRWRLEPPGAKGQGHVRREASLFYGRVALIGLPAALAITALTGSSWAIAGAFLLAVVVGSVAARR